MMVVEDLSVHRSYCFKKNSRDCTSCSRLFSFSISYNAKTSVILIITNETDESTTDIIDWLISKGHFPVRVNGETLLQQLVDLQANESGKVTFTIHDQRSQRLVHSNDVRAVWYRRWARPSSLETGDNASTLPYQLVRYTQSQFHTVTNMFFEALSHCRWLNRPADLAITKLQMLAKARNVGLTVPETLICSTKTSMLDFLSRHKNIIAKSVGDVQFFNEGNRTFGIYTTPLTIDDIDDIGDTFFPTIVQPLIEKQYELRIFYLDGVCYSMAIFSQKNVRTRVDYRKYDHVVPNRRVPHQLPDDIQQKIVRLMNDLKISSGSIDLIKDTAGNFVFLEVNPVGQFGMTSIPCNYRLEEIVADKLIEMSL